MQRECREIQGEYRYKAMTPCSFISYEASSATTSAFSRRSTQLVMSSTSFVTTLFLVARLIVNFLLGMGIWLLGYVPSEPPLLLLLKCTPFYATEMYEYISDSFAVVSYVYTTI